jgi:hypothetical protein
MSDAETVKYKCWYPMGDGISYSDRGEIQFHADGQTVRLASPAMEIWERYRARKVVRELEGII